MPSDWNGLTIAAVWHSQRSGPGNRAERSSLSDRGDGCDVCADDRAVVGDGFVTDEVSVARACCDCGGVSAHERFEHDFAPQGVQLDEALADLDRGGRGVHQMWT